LKESGKVRRSGRIVAVKFDRSLKGGQGSGRLPGALIRDPEMILDLGALGFERRRLPQIRHGSSRISFIKRMAAALVEPRSPPVRTSDI